MQHAVEEIVVLRDRAVRGTLLLEFGDVGPCSECFAAGTAKSDAAHFGIAVELLHGGRDAAPHRIVDGVLLCRLVENQPAHRAPLLD